MTRFRTKPIFIEAAIFNPKKGDIDFWFDCGIGRDEVVIFVISLSPEGEQGIVIKTCDGDRVCHVGDFIVRLPNGEFYPCKPDIFEQTYEPVTE
jgi:hypothetical protein